MVCEPHSLRHIGLAESPCVSGLSRGFHPLGKKRFQASIVHFCERPVRVLKKKGLAARSDIICPLQYAGAYRSARQSAQSDTAAAPLLLIP